MIPTVAVIAKECSPGKVKTRLTPPLTAGQAAGVAQASLSHTLDTLRSMPGIRRRLVFDGTPLAADAHGFEVVPQVAGNLDARLAAICDDVPGPLLILGMDTPQLTAELLEHALQGFQLHSALFGPASDGGFWALGFEKPDGGLIRGVPMSRADTGGLQLERLRSAGLDTAMLPELADIDTFELAVEIAASMPTCRFTNVVASLQSEVRARAAGGAR